MFRVKRQAVPRPANAKDRRLQNLRPTEEFVKLLSLCDLQQVPVAQLDRASASEAEGYRFEPCRGYLEKWLFSRSKCRNRCFKSTEPCCQNHAHRYGFGVGRQSEIGIPITAPFPPAAIECNVGDMRHGQPEESLDGRLQSATKLIGHQGRSLGR